MMSVLNRPSTVEGLRFYQLGVVSVYSATLNGLLFPRLVQCPVSPCKLLASQYSAGRPSTSQASGSVF